MPCGISPARLTLWFAATALAWLPEVACAQQPVKRPNVLVLFSDDQRADTIAALGNAHIQTPHLDKLVKRGTAFTRAYCMGSLQGAVCVPSRAMLMSGRTLFRAPNDFKGVVTWPEMFARAGYRTFMTGKWHNQPASALRVFALGKSLFFGGMTNPYEAPVADISPRHELTNKRKSGKHSVELFSDEAIDFIKAQKGSDQPFLAYVAFNLPHDPRVAPKSYHALYDEKKPPLPPNFLPQHPFNNGEMTVRDEKLAPWPRTPEVVRQHLADYYAAITFLDAQIGRILAALAEAGLAENTIIVFASDSGLAIGSHGLFGKQNLYDHSMRAPLIFAGPGIPQDKRSEGLCYLLDIYPTLGDLAGVKAPAGNEGKSLVPLMTGKSERVRDSIFLAYMKVQRALRDERWKLIVYPQVNHRQLFDLQNDPDEMKNLACGPGHAAEVERLTALLQRQQQELGDKQPLTVEKPLPKEFDFSKVPRDETKNRRTQGQSTPEGTDALGDLLPPGAIARMGSERLRHSGPVFSLAYVPQTSLLASAGQDGTVRLWNSDSGQELRRLHAGKGWARCLAISRDGKLVATGGMGLYVWQTDTGKRLDLIQGKPKELTYAVAFSPDRKSLVSSDGDGVFRLWDVATGNLVRTFSAGGTFISPAIFSPDGKNLITTHVEKDRTGTIRLWEAATGNELRQLRGHTGYIYSLAFSPDGQTLASAGTDKTIRLWRFPSGQPIRNFEGHTHQVLSVSFSPDGKRLASAGGENLVREWEVATGNEIRQIRQGTGERDGNVNTVTYSPDGRTLAAGSNHNRIRLWDAATGKERPTPRGHEGAVFALAFTPDGKALITAANHGTGGGAVISWDTANGKEIRTYSKEGGSIHGLALSSDGATLAASSNQGVFVWKTVSGALVLKIQDPLQTMWNRLALLPQGKLLTSGGLGPTKLWDVATGNPERDAPPWLLAVSPQGLALHWVMNHALDKGEEPFFLRDPITAKDHVKLKLPLPKTAAAQDRLTGLHVVVDFNAAAFSSDGKTAATASRTCLTEHGGAVTKVYDERIHLWETRTGKLLQSILVSSKNPTEYVRIRCLAFSPDGRTLAGGGAKVASHPPSPTVLLWDSASGKELHRILLPPSVETREVACLAFSPDGKTLATGGCDTTALIWKVPPEIANGGKR